MHPCLTVAEILEEIVAYAGRGLRPEYAHERLAGCGGTTLCSLARTCKTFRDLALDKLWHNQDGLYNVVKCLPRESWSVDDTGEMSINDSIGADDWGRFDFYASRIRVLEVTEARPQLTAIYYGNKASSLVRILQVLKHRKGRDTLFPALTDLYWSAYSKETMISMRMFLGNELRVLSIGCKGHFVDLESSLTYLPSSSPKLDQLHIRFDMNVFVPSARFPITLSKLNKVTALHVSMAEVLPMQVAIALFSLPSLEELRLCSLGPATLQEMSDSSTPPTTSPPLQLKRLFIDGALNGDLDCCSRFLRVYSPRDLQQLDVLCDGNEPPSQVALTEFLRAVADTVSRETLTSLSIDLTPPLNDVRFGNRLDNAAGLDQRVFKPLLAFRSLVVVDINVPSFLRVSLDDEMLMCFATSWPALQRLRLEGASKRAKDPMPSGDALAMLVQTCLQLKSICISFDISDLRIPVPQGRPGIGVSNPSITMLHVQYSRIENALAVATFLLALFPNLRAVRSQYSDYDVQRGLWKQVHNALPILSAFRDWHLAGDST